MDIDAAVDRIEEILQPNGRCIDCSGGEGYWKHMLPEDHHPFRAPKPDGWHTYHICAGKIRELKIVTAPNGQTSSLCPYCGEWFRARIER